MDPAGQKQRPFRNGRFAGVDMGDEPDIANFLDGISRNHDVGLGPSPPLNACFDLPAVMDKGPIGLGHPMQFFPPPYRRTLAAGGVHKLVS